MDALVLNAEDRTKLEERVSVANADFAQWLSETNKLQKLLRETGEEVQKIRESVKSSGTKWSIARLGCSGALALAIVCGLLAGIFLPLGLLTAGLAAVASIFLFGGPLTVRQASHLGNNFLKMGHFEKLKGFQGRLECSGPKIMESLIELRVILLESLFMGTSQESEELVSPLAIRRWCLDNLLGKGFHVTVALNSLFTGLKAAVEEWTLAEDKATLHTKDLALHRVMGQLETKAQEIQEMTENVEKETKRLLAQASLALGDAMPGRTDDIQRLAEETFTCCVCLEVASSPLVWCPSCQALIGCQPCIAEALRLWPNCPKCRAHWSSVSKGHLIRGLDVLLQELKKT